MGEHTYVDFIFYRVDPAFRRLPMAERRASVDDFLSLLQTPRENLETRTYHLVGLRSECEFLLWHITKDLSEASAFTSDLLRTHLGSYLQAVYTYVAVTKTTPYSKSHAQNFELGPSKCKYIVVYPFTKTNEWYLLPREERVRMMKKHQEVGATFPTVKFNTTYSFGLGDQDFILAFECDEPKDFSDLVQRLRETEARKYTVSDIPFLPSIRCDAADLPRVLGLV